MRTLAGIAALACLGVPAVAMADLRAYDVDAKYRQEVYEALRGILEAEQSPTGRIERLPTGQLLIDTAPEIHKQIEAVLEEVAARQPTAAPQITLRYWAVLGSPDADDADSVPEILREALDEIESVHGPLGFRILANATLVTESGQYGEVEGHPLSVSQQTFAQGTDLSAEIGIRFAYARHARRVAEGDGNGATKLLPVMAPATQEVNLKTTLEAGDIVVLGENTIDGGELDGTMFYIVHWPGER